MMQESLLSGMELFFVYVVLLYLVLSRLCPFLIAWIIQYKYKCSITIGRITLPYLALRNVRINKNGYSIFFDRVGFTSSFVNSEAPKLLSVVITTASVIQTKGRTSGQAGATSTATSSTSGGAGRPSSERRQKLKSPSLVSNLVQFLGIHVNKVNVWVWLGVDDKKGVHHNVTVDNVSIDGCTTVGGSTICACIVVNFEKVRARVSENWLPTEEDLQSPLGSSYFNGQSGRTLVDLNFDFRLNLIFSPRNSGEFMEHLSVEVERLGISWELKERTLNLLSKVQKNPALQNPTTGEFSSEPKDLKSWLDQLEKYVFMQCIPKEMKFRIFETECRISDELSGTNFESRVSGFSFTSRCLIAKVQNVESVSFESQFDLGLIRIEPDPHQCLFVDQFSNYMKVESRDVKLDLDITNFCLKSHDRVLQFSKTKLMSNSLVMNPFPEGRFAFQETFRAASVKFEISELEVQLSEKSGSIANLFLEAECKDLKEILSEDISSMEIVLKNLSTSLNYVEEGVYRPIAFELLGFHLKREQIGAKITGSRIQIIPWLEELILPFLPAGDPPKVVANVEAEGGSTFKSYLKGVNVEVFDSKFAYVSDNNLCLNADLDALFTTSDTVSRTVSIEGFEVFSSSNFSDCTLNPLFSIPKGEFRTKESNGAVHYNLNVTANSVIYWSPLLHKQIIQFSDKISSVATRFRKEDSKGLSTSSPKVITVHFEKSFSLIAKLAKNHSVKFKTENWRVEKGPEHFEWHCKTLKVSFDKTRIGRWDDFSMAKGPRVNSVTKAHRKSAGLSTKQNATWLVEVAKFNLTFPYGYNFASAYSEEFVTCFKWIKKIHSKTNPDLSKHWLDLFIKIKAARIEVGDDPFEVKLRDNYELLEDEYYENLKRTQVLDNKITQLYKTNLLLSSSKIDELRNQLREKGSTIYIQRSRKLYDNQPMRSHLLLWELEDIQVISMADPAFHGKDTVIKILQELDCDSPWPPEAGEFSTLWCRAVHFDVSKWRVQLRDFPQPLMDSRNIHFWGKLAAAEAAATKRSMRQCEIEIGGPFQTDFVERNMNTLKWYYDLNCDVEALSVAFGPCWEPVLAQCNLAFENIFSPPRDPSRPLPFWDKIRFLFHGRLYTAVNTLTHLLHASLNPYNTTEEMEVTWTDVAIAWTNGKIIFEGDLNIYVRTASKYDDCRMLHLPNVRLTFKLNWNCLSDSNDHHSVSPCAPDKLPEYSSNQEHDSYRAFRSQNLNMNISLETRAGRAQTSYPTAVLYGSTLRWFENLKLILSGTTRPTKRGVLFNNTRLRKIPISRHYKKIRLSVSLNRFHVCYWVSFSMQSGVEILSGKLCSSSEHQLALVPLSDGLIHRPKADWSVVYVNSELNDTEIWLQSSLQQEITNEMNFRRPIEKFFFMSIDKLSYGREALLATSASVDSSEGSRKDTPQHRLVVHELKGAWTSSNRDVAFALFDSFVKVQQLKKNLSTEALKSFFSKHEGPSGSPLKKQRDNNGETNKLTRPQEIASPTAPPTNSRGQMGSSPLSSIQGQNAAASLLQKLISEADSRGVVFSEDLTAPPPQQSLHGLAQCSLDDVILQKWLIELVNCQVLLKGCETSGYVILSASKAHIIQREHKPVWKHGTIVPKTTWIGALEGMQYYATVAAGSANTPEENIQWLSVENIEERDSSAISNVPEMVGSGQSVGGVVSETVGASSDNFDVSVQLQRIVSRCRCEFFYTTFGETGVDKIPSGIPEIPPAPRDLELWDEINKPVEAFTLMHYDLNVFTNSLQYAMILDIINNLVLYVDPKRKEGFEKLQRLRFKLQLQSTEAQRRPIQQMQNHLRTLINTLRRLEKETYNVHKSLLEDPTNEGNKSRLTNLEQQVNECKEQVAAKGEELHMMIMCYKESKLAASQRLSRKRDNKDVSLVRVYEICFKHAQWRLTQTDGQLGIADLVLSNFLYTKTAKSDDSIEHLCELGYITVTNLLPNQIYKEVLVPTLIHASMPVDRQRTLRVFCRDRPPVGGIAVKELFEINISPITIGMTYQFFKTLFKFCFPEKDPDKLDDVDLSASSDSDTAGGSTTGNGSSMSSSSGAGGGGGTIETAHSSSSLNSSNSKKEKDVKKNSRVKRKESKFYVSMNNEKDDVEKMKERAEKNMLFICVKVPEVPVRVSYKGEKDKNIEDVHDVHLLIPTLEYNNITWTWLDFLVAVRNHSKRVLLSQAIKQKIPLWPKVIWSDNSASPQEEDKAKMLLGLPGDSRSLKKSLFGPKK